jgi:hypothetical protein
MRSMAMLATLSILAIWSSSADAGCVVYREPCGYYGKVCRPHGGPVGRFCPGGSWVQYRYHGRGLPVGPYWPPYWDLP